MRIAMFVSGFLMSTMLLLAGLACLGVAVANPKSPTAGAAVLGGALLVIPFSAWMAAEWAAFQRPSPSTLKSAALYSLMFGAFLLFAGTVALFGQKDLPAAKRPSPAWVAPLAVLGLWFLYVGTSRRRELAVLESQDLELEETDIDSH